MSKLPPLSGGRWEECLGWKLEELSRPNKIKKNRGKSSNIKENSTNEDATNKCRTIKKNLEMLNVLFFKVEDKFNFYNWRGQGERSETRKIVKHSPEVDKIYLMWTYGNLLFVFLMLFSRFKLLFAKFFSSNLWSYIMSTCVVTYGNLYSSIYQTQLF